MDESKIIKVITDNHNAVMNRLNEQDNALRDIKVDMHGDKDRGIEGVIPKLNRLARLLWPQEVLFKIPKGMWLLILMVLDVVLEQNKMGVIALIGTFVNKMLGH